MGRRAFLFLSIMYCFVGIFALPTSAQICPLGSTYTQQSSPCGTISPSISTTGAVKFCIGDSIGLSTNTAIPVDSVWICWGDATTSTSLGNFNPATYHNYGFPPDSCFCNGANSTQLLIGIAFYKDCPPTYSYDINFRPVTIRFKPKANFNTDTSCVGAIADVTIPPCPAACASGSTTDTTRVTWDMGDASLPYNFWSTGVNIPVPQHAYTSPGTYTITLTLTNDSCGFSILQKTIVILDNTVLQPTLTAIPACAPGVLSVTDIDPFPGSTFTWSIVSIPPGTPVGGSLVSDSSVEVTINNPGTYLFSIDTTNGCCFDWPNSRCSWDSTVTFGSAPQLNQLTSFSTACDSIVINWLSAFQIDVAETHVWTITSFPGGAVIYSNNTNVPPNFTINTPGMYVITASSLNVCDTVSINDTLSVLGPTSINPVLSSLSNCAPDSIQVTTLNAINLASINWTSFVLSGSGTITPAASSLNQPVFQVSAAGSYIVNAQAIGCCTGAPAACQFSDTLSFNQLPVLLQATPYTDTCGGFTINWLQNFNIASYDSVRWKIDSVSSGSPTTIFSDKSANPVNQTLTTPGQYIVSVTLYNLCTTAAGIAFRDTFSILLPTTVSTSFVTSGTICLPDSIVATGTVITNGTSYGWTAAALGGGVISPLSSTVLNPVFLPANPDTYVITLEATGCCTDPASACERRDTFFVSQSPQLTQTLPITDRCDTLTAFNFDFNDYFQLTTGVWDSAFFWSVTDGGGTIIGQSTASSLPVVPITSYGNYTITAQAANRCSTITFTTTFNNNPPPPLTLTVDTVLCKYDPVLALSASPVNGNWSINGIPLPLAQFRTDTVSRNTYYALYELGSGSCIVRDSVKIIVSGGEINAGPDITYCDNAGIDTLITIQSGMNGTWTGPGITDPILGIIDINSIPGNSATLIYTATDSICTVKDTLLITLAASPTTAPLWPGDTLCRNVAYNFINLSSPDTARWNFGDTPAIFIGDTVSHFYSNTGLFIVTISIVNAANCRAEFKDTVTVTDIPLSLFTLNADTLCEGDSIQVLNNNPDQIYTTYSWTANAVSIGNIYEPGWYLYTLPTDTIANVTIEQTSTNTCGTTTYTDSYAIYPKPVAAFNVDQPSGCSPDTVLFSNVSYGSPESYAWYINGVLVSMDSVLPPQIFIADSTDSLYVIELIVSNRCGVDTITRTVTVHPPAAFPFYNIDYRYGCAPLTVTLTSSVPSGSIVSWNFGDNNLGVGDTITHTYTQPGIYYLWQIVTNCGTDSIYKQITVYDTPVVGFTVGNPRCSNKAVEFFNASPGLIGNVWDFGDNSPRDSSTSNPVHLYPNPGSYTATLIGTGVATSPGVACIDSAKVTFQVNDIPDAQLQVNTNSGCFPFTVDLTAVNLSQNAIRYDWFLGNGDTLRGNLFTSYTYTDPGTYPITLVAIDNNNCTDTTTFNSIIVHPEPQPVAAFLPDPLNGTILDPVIDFINLSTFASSYIWNFGDGVFTSVTSPFHEYTTPGPYTVTLIAGNNYGCNDTAIRHVYIYTLFTLYIPNAFTPGGKNPVFKPEMEFYDPDSYQFSVFNRWGAQVFSTRDPLQGWNGEANGKVAPEGVYLYVVRVKPLPTDLDKDFGIPVEKTGVFTLLR